MCIYTRFRYLCLHEKLKIAHACNKASIDPHGILTCPDDPHPHANDGMLRTYADRTYGVGVCSSIHCAWDHSILPLGDYGDNHRFGNSTSFEDNTEIVDSAEAREDRVSRWYRLLNADQQLDRFKTEYPLPLHKRNPAGHALLEFPFGAAVTALDSMQWQELNPLFLNPAMLQWCIFSRLLPASIADNRKSNTISPHQPIIGPFKFAGFHRCPKRYGFCKTCGENIGDPALKEATLSHRQSAALAALTNEDLSKEDPRGTVLDPNVDLKWDDEKGLDFSAATVWDSFDVTVDAADTTDAALLNTDSPTALQAQDSFAFPSFIDEYMTTYNSSVGLSVEQSVDLFIAERQAVDQVVPEIPPDTLRIVHQMVNQMLNGGVVRPSYDSAANELYEQVLQHKYAGLI